MSYINSTKKIALVDCNSFYVSCERLFNPKIQYKPVVVLSNNDGCVISRSKEAKLLGIKMGEPYFKVKELIRKNKVYIFSSNYALYGDLSRRVMKVLKTFSPNVEIYSIDEAFIDLSFLDEEEVEKYGKEIRAKVLKWTGIPTSVGISSTKTLSKVANHIAKKEKTGVMYLYKNIDEKLKNFPISDVWGVGKQLTKFYIKNGINNAYQLKSKPNTWVKKSTNVLGSRTAMELSGISCIGLEIKEEKRKNCCVSRSFGKKVTDIQKLEEAITTYCLNAAEKIRADDQLCRRITVFIRTSPFNKNRKYYSNGQTIDLPIPTSNSIELIKNAKQVLKNIYKPNYYYQKAGIILSHLSEATNNKNLFSSEKDEKINNLMKSIDTTNYKYGRSTLSLATAGVHKKSNLKREYYSKIDTADFYALPTIKTT